MVTIDGAGPAYEGREKKQKKKQTDAPTPMVTLCGIVQMLNFQTPHAELNHPLRAVWFCI
jgi:hypothetical protein